MRTVQVDHGRTYPEPLSLTSFGRSYHRVTQVISRVRAECVAEYITSWEIIDNSQGTKPPLIQYPNRNRASHISECGPYGVGHEHR